MLSSKSTGFPDAATRSFSAAAKSSGVSPQREDTKVAHLDTRDKSVGVETDIINPGADEGGERDDGVISLNEGEEEGEESKDVEQGIREGTNDVGRGGETVGGSGDAKPSFSFPTPSRFSCLSCLCDSSSTFSCRTSGASPCGETQSLRRCYSRCR